MVIILCLQLLLTAVISAKHGSTLGTLPFILLLALLVILYIAGVNWLNSVTTDELCDRIYCNMKKQSTVVISAVVAFMYLCLLIHLFYIRGFGPYSTFATSFKEPNAWWVPIVYSFPLMHKFNVLLLFCYISFVAGFSYLYRMPLRFIKTLMLKHELAKRGFEVLIYDGFYVPVRLTHMGKRKHAYEVSLLQVCNCRQLRHRKDNCTLVRQ